MAGAARTERHEVVGIGADGVALGGELDLADQLHFDALVLHPLAGQRHDPHLRRTNADCVPKRAQAQL